MGDDIFYGLSKGELKKRIDEFASQDQRSLPPRAKIFAAVANLLDSGLVREIQRGLSSNAGVPAILYAKELLTGPLYPGTLSAVGHGIYLAATSVPSEHHPAFPWISKVAAEYATKGDSGIIIRCGLKHDSKVADYEELKGYLRENRNRAKDVGITDLGAFAASLGLDGYYCDGLYDEHPEQVWIVVNRKALVFQNIALQVDPHTVI